ncbi:hypothetical protein KCH_00450 [Kitasatospora cheerisanensis KCTC 2395]|uniref:Uncharacterized protein n=1 Tax=Kitasatospora cheerisanensis KCTC 2395 TaxID=1348663 RepID=A0A066ZDL7_9ACTN|nr:hypothetical protein KCH_00450 [Kitasatospora cheerisanensis KCTC 2395]
MGLVRADDLADGPVSRDVLQDGDPVVLGETPGRGREPECLVDLVAPQDGGELDDVGHLGADPETPAGPASLSQRPAPGPMSTNASSASERGRSLGR